MPLVPRGFHQVEPPQAASPEAHRRTTLRLRLVRQVSGGGASVSRYIYSRYSTRSFPCVRLTSLPSLWPLFLISGIWISPDLFIHFHYQVFYKVVVTTTGERRGILATIIPSQYIKGRVRNASRIN
jgi:hypothetical protein